MKKTLLSLVMLFIATGIFAQVDQVSIRSDADGDRLIVNGQEFMMNGMNWDYIPIGTNTVNARFWEKSDEVIMAGLDIEMSLLKNMGVNVIRQYTGVPARWIQYIYENYGIYTMLNHSFGRYGLTIDGAWIEITDYANPRTQEFLLQEVETLVAEYKNTPGLLLYLLGNENNYGLFWAGAETEDFPDDEEEKKFIGEKRGRPMYRLMNEAAKLMKSMDANHPVAICNGDVLFIDIVAEECKDVDIYGTNTYRGVSFGDMFDVVKEKLDMPLMFTEFGADAFNAISNSEDQKSQAYYMVGNWKEIYANAAGLGKTGNSIGGFTFQFSDGWWKFGFNDREGADVHDNNASWANGGYAIDLAPGENNMNEEWFGICAKGQTDPRGLYQLFPRAAYYALKEAHQLNPYGEGMTGEFVENYFKNINLMDAVLKARGDKAAMVGEQTGMVRLSNLQAKFATFSTGGTLITTPDSPDPDDPNTFPNQLGFDHLQSYFIGVEGNPAPNMRAEVNVNVVGNVARNPINEIFYENNSRPVDVSTDVGDVVVADINRVRVYQAEFEWKAKQFDLKGFYRTGHYHWGYEGDFFGFYPEANYGPNLDIYNGEILGTEIEGKGIFKGLKVAVGPQLWWGANPTMLFKYNRHIGKFNVTGIYHRDFEQDIILDENGRRVLNVNQLRSGVIPPWPTERASIHIEREFGKFGVELGGIWAGSPLNGISFQDVRGTSGNYTIFEDRIQASDNWGGKVKLTYEGGKFNWYGQASAMGLIANGGADPTIASTGWKLQDTGSGNVTSVLTGFRFAAGGNFFIAPNFMWQEPIVDAMPQDVQGPGRLRNIIDDPFSVRANRKTTAGEILFTYDPTPGTWMYDWDNDRTEDAPFAFDLGFVYRHLPTTMDAHIGFLANRQFFAFPNSAPAEDLWEVHSRIVSKIGSDFGMVGRFYYGNGQGNGDSDRLIKRFGGDVRILYKNFKLRYEQKINDWGPFDYHRDFNLTFPVQMMLDISTTLGKPDWFILPSTQLGIRGIWRSLNEFSPRYAPNVAAAFSNEPILSPVGFGNGSEWEIMTYIHINIGK